MRTEKRLREMIAGLPPGTPLPPDRDLGARFGVSRKTVEKAMQQLAAEDLVERARRRGTSVRRDAADFPALASRRSSVDDLVALLLDSIRRGEYKSGEALPSVKYLARACRVGRITAIRALAELRRRREIVRIGRTHWVGHLRRMLSPAARRGEVVMLLRDAAHLPTIFHSERFASEAFRTMEEHLAYAGYVLRFSFTEELPQLYREWRRARRYPTGLIVYDTNGNELPRIPLLRDSTPFLRDTAHIPIVLDMAWLPVKLWRGKIYVFDHEETSTAIAQAVARFVCERGWERVRVFADNDEVLTNPRRAWQFTHLLKLRSELVYLNPAIEHRMVLVNERPGACTELPQDAPWLSRAEYELSRHTAVSFDTVRPEISFSAVLASAFCPPRGREMWIFQRDRHAAEAISWAREHRVGIPGDVAIIGLENDPSLYHLGLTRCNPDFTGLGYLMAHAIIGDFDVPTDTRGMLPNRAWIVEKRTTP
jgi:DNA-binding transcriptional regulator YhcF (GntR family)